MVLSRRSKAILSWALTIGAGVVLGALAAWFRLLESTAAVVALWVIFVLLLALRSTGDTRGPRRS